jgi:hypothetical protein
MATEIQALVDILRTGGPFAVLVFLGLAYWKKDQYVVQLHRQILDTTVQNVQAITAMKEAIGGLKDALNQLSSKL